MKPYTLLLLIATSLLWIGPVYAHGDEKHGEAASVAASSEKRGAHDPADMADMHAQGDQAAGGHDAAVMAHGDAAGHADESATGAAAVLKKLHPATIHFPIALFLMAALTELFVIARRGAGLEAAVGVLVYGGAAGAVVAAVFGWIHTGLWFGGDAVMQVHRWTGMLIAVLGIVLAALVRRPRKSRTLLRTGIFSVAILVLIQGALGGELAHGPNHLGISWL